VLWWVSLKTIGTRAALGQGGPLVYLAILLFVALATAHARRVRGPGSPAPAAGSARSWVSPIVLAVVLVAALGLALSLLGPLPGPGGVWLVGAALLAVAFGLAAFVQALTRAARRAPAPSFPVSPVRTRWRISSPTPPGLPGDAEAAARNAAGDLRAAAQLRLACTEGVARAS